MLKQFLVIYICLNYKQFLKLGRKNYAKSGEFFIELKVCTYNFVSSSKISLKAVGKQFFLGV